MKILFFGDIIGKIGRKAIKQILPELKEEYQPDLILANGENLAHGVGITEKVLSELKEVGVDLFTSGNHIFDKAEAASLLEAKDPLVLRPANYPPTVPGCGFKLVEVGSKSVLVISLMGRVFIRENFDCPFRKIDEILSGVKAKNLAGIIVDFHGEATSEKIAFGWYVDGRVSAVLGTHTHVPTADIKILPQGTAYITDVGMVGAVDSVIGDKKEPIIKSFLDQTSFSLDIPEEGEVEVDAVFLEISAEGGSASGGDSQIGLVKEFKRVDRKIKV